MKKSKLFIASIVCFVLGAIGLFSLPTDFSTDLLGGTFIVIVAGVVLILIDKQNSKSKNNANYTQPYQPFNYQQMPNQQNINQQFQNQSMNNTNYTQPYQPFNYQQMPYQQNINQPFNNQQVQQPIQQSFINAQSQYTNPQQQFSTSKQPTPTKTNYGYSRTIATMDRDVDVKKEPGEYSQEKEFTVVGVIYEGRQENLAMLCDTKITDAEIEWTPFNNELGIKVYFEGLEMGWVSRKNLPFFEEYEDKIRYISNAFVGVYHSGEYFARFRVRYYAPKDCD